MYNHILSCKEAKQKDLVDYLASLGHEPKKIQGANYWYLSPFREEKTPSFKIDKRFNIWYDHGMGVGGNLIDFGIRYHQCTIQELLQKLTTPSSFQQQNIQVPTGREQKNSTIENNADKLKDAAEDPARIKILSIHDISSHSLVNYLESRCIAPELADKYCKEVRYQTHGKIYYALGFKNDSGGYELRSEHFKGSSSPKGVTFIDNSQEQVAVFEGFFSFLSFQAITQQKSDQLTNFLVLNSLAFFEKSRSLMEQHGQIHLFLDRDQAGMHNTQKAQEWGPQYKDRSDFYIGRKDLNEWLTDNTQAPQQRQKQGRHL